MDSTVRAEPSRCWCTNTSQQVGGSIGTALLNAVAAGAAASYLVGRRVSLANLQAALVHSYTTAFLYCALFFVVAAVVAALVFQRGALKALAPTAPIPTSEAAADHPQTQVCRVRIACR
jgi:Na+/proline symporter